MAEAKTVTVSDEEMAVVEKFRQQMANPDQGETVSVVNTSLGMDPRDGTKIQFKGGKPDWKPEPAARGYDRWAARERRRLEASAAAKARAQKNKKSLFRRVQDAAEKLEGRNVADTVALIEMQSPQDREVYILAEERGQNRVSVIRNAGFQVTRKMREALQAELDIIESATQE